MRSKNTSMLAKTYARFQRGAADWSSADVKQFFILFSAISLAFLVVWFGTQYLDRRLANERQRDLTRNSVAQVRVRIGELLETYAGDLRIIEQGRALHRVADGMDAFRSILADDLTIFGRERPEIAQIRFLDVNGLERVRIDRIAGKVVAAPDAELQDKSTRYYFSGAARLPPGGVFVSALDLNVEHGRIELPWRPMLRLAMPVNAPSGAFEGVLVINLAADRILAELDVPEDDGAAGIKLLNPRGYWIAGQPRQRLWGEQGDRTATMASEMPAVWAAIEAVVDGEAVVGGVRYLFQRVRAAAHVLPRGGTGTVEAVDPYWIVLGVVQDVTVADLFQSSHLPGVVFGLVVIALIAAGWTRASAERRRAEAASRKAAKEVANVERMASLGSLVAGVAHELNTPIGNAVSIASTLAEQAREFGTLASRDEIGRAALDEFEADMRTGTGMLLSGLRRASVLIQSFKQIAADRTSEQRRSFMIAELLDSTVGVMASQFRHGPLSLQTRVEANVELDSYPGPLGQVISNLVANAQVHAFGPEEAGTITLSARQIPDGWVEIAVADTGAGLEPEVANRVFEPFFTTRLGTGGSGLGLSIAHNIVTGVLGGAIAVESQPGAGSTFTVTIPVVAPAAAAERTERVYNADRRRSRESRQLARRAG